MSGKLVGEVYKLALPRNERDVLLAMAENADNRKSTCHPSVEYLAWKIGCSVRKIQYALRALEQRGAITAIENKNGGRGKRPEYLIDLTGLPQKNKFIKGAKTNTKRVQNQTVKGAESDSKGCKNEHEKGAKTNTKRVQNQTNPPTPPYKEHEPSVLEPSDITVSLEPSGGNISPDGAKKSPTDQQQLFVCVANICRINLKTAPGKTKGVLHNAVKSLLKAEATVESLTEWETSWYANDWRGQKNQPPTIEQLRESYGTNGQARASPLSSQAQATVRNLQNFVARKTDDGQ